jgi:hypothetical protein
VSAPCEPWAAHRTQRSHPPPKRPACNWHARAAGATPASHLPRIRCHPPRHLETALLAATASSSADANGRDVISKVVPRMALFGALPPSILPHLVAVRNLVDSPKNPDRKLLRVIQYLVQLAASDGCAGTPVPFSPLTGGRRGVRTRRARAWLRRQRWGVTAASGVGETAARGRRCHVAMPCSTVGGSLLLRCAAWRRPAYCL